MIKLLMLDKDTMLIVLIGTNLQALSTEHDHSSVLIITLFFLSISDICYSQIYRDKSSRIVLSTGWFTIWMSWLKILRPPHPTHRASICYLRPRHLPPTELFLCCERANQRQSCPSFAALLLGMCTNTVVFPFLLIERL